ncbi:MAG: ABC transporter substrate-binding protein [Syntrophomonas sp.]|jgi:iron complex transport system substrate-binding protein
MKTNRKIVALLLVFVLSMCCLTGCTKRTANETPDAKQTRTVTDMAGRTVTIPAEIKSIGTFGAIGVLNAFVETMGAGNKICNEGSTSFVKSPSWAKYQYLFTPQIKDCPPFQGADSEILIENVLAKKPDLCLTMMPELVDQLEAQGLNVLYLSWTETEDVKKCITLLGEVLNAPDVAADYLAYFDKMVAKAEDMTKGIKEEDKKTVAYGSVSSFTQPHIIAEWWIPKAGGISVTSKGETSNKERYVYTMEDLLKWNPDVMIVSSSAEQKNVLADARFAGITAVKNKEIYIMPRIAHVWGNRTTEQPLTIMWTMNKLYPQIMTDEALAKEVSYFYSHFFKHDFTNEQIKEIIG